MANHEKPGIENLTEELRFWNTYCELRRTKGVDVPRIYNEWAADLKQGLSSPGAREVAEILGILLDCLSLPSEASLTDEDHKADNSHLVDSHLRHSGYS